MSLRLCFLAVPLVGVIALSVLVAGQPPVSPTIRNGDDPEVKKDAPPKGPDGKPFPRGMKPTPQHVKLRKAANHPFVVPKELKLPTSVAYVPDKMSFWLNNQYGDCVTAEEAFAQDTCGFFITDATVKTWAGKYGFLNGAYLTEVMDQMIQSGFKQDNTTYSIGSYSYVDFGTESTLQAALSYGPVKIGIDANALPPDAGNKNGWYAYGGRVGQFGAEDHCTSLCGFGPPTTMFAAVGIDTVPRDWPTKSTVAYLHFTWNTIGVVDHDWIMSTVAEAYLRNPTAVRGGVPQPNPGPGPNPPAPPVPPTPPVPPNPPVPGTGYTGTITYTYVNGILTAVTQGQPTPTVGLEKTLLDAGVSPAIVADVLKLIADLQAKASFMTLLSDVLKIITDLSATQKNGRREESHPWSLAA